MAAALHEELRDAALPQGTESHAAVPVAGNAVFLLSNKWVYFQGLVWRTCRVCRGCKHTKGHAAVGRRERCSAAPSRGTKKGPFVVQKAAMGVLLWEHHPSAVWGDLG